MVINEVIIHIYMHMYTHIYVFICFHFVLLGNETYALAVLSSGKFTHFRIKVTHLIANTVIIANTFIDFEP